MTVDEGRSLPSSATGHSGDLVYEPPEVLAAEPESIGVALSGGGVRAALFSLGVLVGLVETGENRKVTSVSSVSGGSIVNAAVAQSCRFADTSASDFDKVARPIAEGLCRRGTFVFSWSALWALARVVGPQLGVIGIFGFLGWYGVASAIETVFGPSEHVPWAWIITGAVAIFGLTLFLTRGLLQEGLYSSFLASLPEGKRRLLEDLEDSPTTHVIVATDLVSGAPVFFSRQFVCCPTFGWGVPDRTRTASAVYASAAFPVVFPVRRFFRRGFHFQNGVSPPPFPRLLKLNDGGVYNNLGTDWFDELNRQGSSEIWEFGNLPLSRPMVPVTRRLVVNAGAASRGLRKVPPFFAISRTMSVLYDNTVRPRLETMRENAHRNLLAHVVIDISESPYNIARRLADVDVSSFPADQKEAALECQGRARELAELLGRRGETYWIEFARQTSSTKTKLTRAGLESGARMMLHGYLSTVVVMHAFNGVGLPSPLRDEGYFLDLAGRGASGPTKTSEASENDAPTVDLDSSSGP